MEIARIDKATILMQRAAASQTIKIDEGGSRSAQALSSSASPHLTCRAVARK
jgi:hypothetical protein